MNSDGDIATTKSRLGWLLGFVTTVLLPGGPSTSATTVGLPSLAESTLYESVGTTVDVHAMPFNDIQKEIKIACDILQLVSSDDFEQSDATDLYLRQLAYLVQGPLDQPRIVFLSGQLRLARVRLCNEVATVGQWLAIAEVTDPDADRHILPARFTQAVAGSEPEQDLWSANADPDLEIASYIFGRADADPTPV